MRSWGNDLGSDSKSRKLPVWELRSVPHEVSLGLWGRVCGGDGGCQFFRRFLQLLCGARTIFRRWLLGCLRARLVSFGRFSGAFQEVMRAFGGGFGHFRRLMRAFGGCFGRLELMFGRRTSVPRPVHCRAFVPARGSQVFESRLDTPHNVDP